MGEPIKDSVSVDCSCYGNPGITEYRCIDNLTGEILFENNIGHATNNIGEFLAIVHYLAWHKDNPERVLYSDSQTAIGWVFNRRFNSSLERTKETQKAWDLLYRAVKWLNQNNYRKVKIKKWITYKWGEISADYGRKQYKSYVSRAELEAIENLRYGLRKINYND